MCQLCAGGWGCECNKHKLQRNATLVARLEDRSLRKTSRYFMTCLWLNKTQLCTYIHTTHLHLLGTEVPVRVLNWADAGLRGSNSRMSISSLPTASRRTVPTPGTGGVRLHLVVRRCYFRFYLNAFFCLFFKLLVH